MQGTDGNTVMDFLSQTPGKQAVFIPRLKLKTVQDQVYENSTIHDVEKTLEKVVFTMNEAGVVRLPITVPYTSFRVRMDQLGIKSKVQLVGWLYYYPVQKKVLR